MRLPHAPSQPSGQHLHLAGECRRCGTRLSGVGWLEGTGNWRWRVLMDAEPCLHLEQLEAACELLQKDAQHAAVGPVRLHAVHRHA